VAREIVPINGSLDILAHIRPYAEVSVIDTLCDAFMPTQLGKGVFATQAMRLDADLYPPLIIVSALLGEYL
jgi:hypothetical protein